MENYTEFLKIIKEIIMKYGLWKTAIAISLSVSLPILIWQLANIINAIAALK